MLELLFGIVAGTAATSWLHWKARHRSSGSKPGQGAQNMPSAPPVEGPLSGAMRAAIVFMSVSPEAAARLFNQIGPEEVERITQQITQLPIISPARRQQVLAEFAASLGIAVARLEEAAREEPALIASALGTLAKLSPR